MKYALPGIKIGHGIIFLAVFGLIALFLACSIDLTKYELGALLNIIAPLFSTLAAMISFSIICWITKRQAFRLGALIILCAYLLYVGIALHLEKEYWPLVF